MFVAKVMSSETERISVCIDKHSLWSFANLRDKPILVVNSYSNVIKDYPSQKTESALIDK